MSSLRVDIRNVANASVLDLHGDLSADGESALREAYKTSVDRQVPNIVFNLAHTDYINTSGISVLITMAMTARKQDITLALAGANAHYQKVFDLVRLSTFVSMFDDETSALEAFG